MPAYFLESSAFVKRFAREDGTSYVVRLFRPSLRNRLFASRISEVEVCSALVRRMNGRTISAAQGQKALRRLDRDFPARIIHFAVNEPVLVEAVRLAKDHGLRAYDSVQLATVLVANMERRNLSLSPLILVSADAALNLAAIAEGVVVEVPLDKP